MDNRNLFCCVLGLGLVVLLVSACAGQAPATAAAPRIVPPAATQTVAPPTYTPTEIPPTPTGVHRDIKIAYVIIADAQTQYSDLIRSFQTGVDKDLADRDIAVTWATITENDESLRSLQSNPKGYDIVMLAIGQPPADISAILRGWLQSGGIIWAFDNGTFSTWRNKDLFGGLLPGADVNWEPPEQVQVMVQGLNVLPYDDASPLAKGVTGDINVTGNVTVSQDATTKVIYANLTSFDRALDASTTPLLKAQKVGEAVIGGQTPQPSGWVVVGLAKMVEKGQAVVLPFLALDLVPVQQFQANLIEWGLMQVGK
jgi:hypothetical protein